MEAASNGLKRTNSPKRNTNAGERYNGHGVGNMLDEVASDAIWYIPNATSMPPITYMNTPTKNAGDVASHKPKMKLPNAANGKMGCCVRCR